MRLPSQTTSLIVLVATTLLMAGCAEKKPSPQPVPTESDSEPVPDSWQKHLKPTTLDKSKPMAMDEEIYVPIYSQIYDENQGRTMDLAATLSFRNVDPDHSIIIKSVRYYSTDGKLLKEYLKGPVLLNAMATADFVITSEDSSGGSGANFVVDWVAPTKVLEPLAESVMVATGSPRSMAFTSRGIVIKKNMSAEKLTPGTK
ncbi:MAG TPA: DUF3124 domain-containing protein [Drouetiella sp.]|jgi:Protein of unknown function (DUF3124)